MEGAPAPCAIAVMAKASKPGRTKTRLIPALGADAAAALNTAFLRDIADTIAAAARQRPITGYVAFGPPEEAGFFEATVPGLSRLPAWQPDFGETLAGTIAALLGCGHSAVCLLNADSPTLPPHHLVDAADRLARPDAPIVLGPSSDGGYYLIGMTRLHDALFREISWSTEVVFEETLARAAAAGLAVECLPEWYDVDDDVTLARLRRDLADLRSTGPTHTRRLLASLAGTVA